MGLDIYFHKTKCNELTNLDVIEKFDEQEAKQNFMETYKQSYKKFKNVYERGNDEEIEAQSEKFITSVKPFFGCDFYLNKLTKNDLTPALIGEWFNDVYDGIYKPCSAYFRKVNFIWRFFEDLGKVSFGEENWCIVELSDLDTLIELCGDVLEHYANEFNEMKSFLEKEENKMAADHNYKTDWESNILKLEDNDDFAMENLPTQSGFFFGSTSYDYWYLLDVEDAFNKLKILRKNLHPETEHVYVYFSY